MSKFTPSSCSVTALRRIVVTLCAVAVGVCVFGAATAMAAGNPGVPQPGVPVYSESFSNQNATTPIPLTSYTGSTGTTGADGETYKAAAGWLPGANLCDGWIINFNSTRPTGDTGCAVAGGNDPLPGQLDKAQALGLAEGQTLAEADTNQALTEDTNIGNPNIQVYACTPANSPLSPWPICTQTPPPAGAVEFQTANSNIPATGGHYYAISAYFSETSCQAAQASETFNLLENGTPVTLGSGLNPCANQTDFGPEGTPVTKLQSGAVQLPTAATPSLGLQLLDMQNATTGNDVAFDLPQIVDVTPALDKSFSPSTIEPGQTSTLTLTVTNTSELDAKDGWSFTDSLPSGMTIANPADTTTTCENPAGTSGTSATVTATAGGTSVAVNGSLVQNQMDCTVTVQVTATGLGSYTNGPSNFGTTLFGVTPPGTATLNVVAPPTVAKSFSPSTINAGATSTLTVTLNNANATADTGAAFTDTFPTNVVVASTPNITTTCGGTDTATSGSGSLSISGATIPAAGSCTVTVNVTSADGGTYVNTIPSGAVTTTNAGSNITPASATLIVNESPSLTIVKSASPTTVTTAGQTVDYSFLVTNTGDVTLNPVVVNDTSFTGSGTMSAIVCPETALAAGASETCTASYQVTQADINAGSVTNTATATGTPPDGTPVTSPPSTATVTATPAPALTIVKSATPTTVATVGQTVTYHFLVTNTGNVTLNPVVVNDTKFSGTGTLSTISCPDTSLAVAGSETCTATYQVTQADLNAGSITNTATATGTPPNGGTPVTSPPSSTTVTAAPAPALTIVKSATPTTVTAAGQTVDYSFLVTNTGNVTLSPVVVNDTSFSGTGTLSAISCPDTSLAPGTNETCTATYKVTQADIDAGSVTNTATATGTPPNGGTPVTSPPSTATVTATPAPGLTIVKSATPTTVGTVGQTVTYSFLVTNTGNVTLSPVVVNDTSFSGTGTLSAISCPDTSLAPGTNETCTATYKVTQADLSAGKITNTATATGTPPNGGTPVTSPPSTVTIPASDLTVTKSVSPTSGTTVNEGQTLTYTLTFDNSQGDTTTPTFSYTDDLADVLDDATLTSGPTVSPAGNGVTASAVSGSSFTVTGTLAAGADVTVTYTVKVDDPDTSGNQVLNNYVFPTGSTPPTSCVSTNPDCTINPIAASPSLSVVKTADPTTVNTAGQTVDYSFLVTNTGNVTLNPVVVNDTSFSGTGTLSAISCPDASLAAGAAETCTATYKVTQADIDAGSITNTATATGTPPNGGTPVTSPPSTATVTATPAPALTIVKSATPTTVAAAGQTVDYSFVVTNTGNVTLNPVVVNDTSFSGTGTLSAISCPDTSLAVGEQETCTATYKVTQADIDAGKITNTATATGTPPNGGTPVTSPPSTATVTANQSGSLTVVKTADPTTVNTAGQTVDYSFLVTNTGNVTLNPVVVNDTSFSGTGTLSAISCPDASLAAGAAETCTATYKVTQADIDAGSITNTATATGTPPNGGTPVTSPPSTATVTATPAPALTIVKSATPTTVAAAGQTVDYSFVVTNTGNVTLNPVVVNDTSFSGTGTLSAISCPDTSLAVGEQETCTATYKVTQADIDAGKITNTATATGTPPNGGTPVTSPPSTATVTANQSGSLTVVKTADPTTVNTAGQTVDYSFLVTNTGNVTLNPVVVNDTSFSGTGTLSAISCPDASLAAGAAETCTATYKVTQADIDAGSITNTATATGTPPNGGTPVTSPPSTATVTATPAPALTIVKSATPTTVAAAGQTVDYSFVVTNTGNVTLNPVVVNDTSFSGTGTLSAISCPDTSLAVGEQETCTATYKVTQADIDAGKITNTATATGTPPNGGTPVTSPPSTAKVTAASSPGITIVKSANVKSYSAAGVKVTYFYEVTNTGNVTLHDVTVTDPMKGLSAVSCPSSTLAPGASEKCSATYTTTAADLRAGKLHNTGTAHGIDPTGTSVTAQASLTIPEAGISIKKTASVKEITAPGEKVTYYYRVTNTGHTRLDPVVVTDPMKGLSKISCPRKSLNAGQSETCKATRTTTKSDMSKKTVDNTGTATGVRPGGGNVSAASTVKIPVIPPLTKLFEVDTWHMKTQACANRVFRSLDYPRFDYNALRWTWTTPYGVHCFSDRYQIVRVTLPRNASPRAWVTAINKTITTRGVGRLRTAAGLKSLRAGTITIAWSVPKNGWLLGRSSHYRAPHVYFARS